MRVGLGVLRVEIARGLDVLGQGVVRGERQAVREALLRGDLQRVVPDLARVELW